MTRITTENDFSDHIDSDLNWRRKELSDLKNAIRNADAISQQVLLKSLITMTYAHWEGYIKTCTTKYFDFLTLKKKKFSELERQVHLNSFLVRLDSLYLNKADINNRCDLINEILNSTENRFSFINSSLIDTKSNLNTNVIKDMCRICGIEADFFEDKRFLIDTIILKRRNAIAHGQQESVSEIDPDKYISDALGLMQNFKTLLENKIYTKGYLSQ